jgi:hypothetical protein
MTQFEVNAEADGRRKCELCGKVARIVVSQLCVKGRNGRSYNEPLVIESMNCDKLHFSSETSEINYPNRCYNP